MANSDIPTPPETPERNAEVKTPADLESVRSIIGEENYTGGLAALADSARLWVFLSPEELEANTDLSPQEKSQCAQIFDQKLGYAGWLRPARSTMPDPAIWELLMRVRPGGSSGNSGSGGKWSH